MFLKLKKGFSLVELLVVIAIIGILAAVGITAYSGYTKNAKAKAAMSQFSQVEAVINAEMARCAIGEGDYVWVGDVAGINAAVDGWITQNVGRYESETDPAFLSALEIVEIGRTTALDDAAAPCSNWPNHTNIVSYINTGLADSLGMKNPYNADLDFATEVGAYDAHGDVLGGLTVWCGDNGGNQCVIEVLHKEGSPIERTVILEY